MFTVAHFKSNVLEFKGAYLIRDKYKRSIEDVVGSLMGKFGETMFEKYYVDYKYRDSTWVPVTIDNFKTFTPKNGDTVIFLERNPYEELLSYFDYMFVDDLNESACDPQYKNDDDGRDARLKSICNLELLLERMPIDKLRQFVAGVLLEDKYALNQPFAPAEMDGLKQYLDTEKLEDVVAVKEYVEELLAKLGSWED